MTVDPQLKALYSCDGPFATVYLDASRDTESADHEIELRWRALHDRLAADGAGEGTLSALAERIAAHRGSGRHGLVLVACDDEVLFDATLPQPPVREEAALAPLPYLMPYFAQRGHVGPHVVVVADRTGADITVSDGSVEAMTSVTGSEQHPVHRTGRNDWSERHFQHRVENAWEANARDVAAAVTDQVTKLHVHIVLVAGDERARALLRRQLAETLPPQVEVVDLEHGGRASGSSEDVLDESVHDAMLRQGWRERRTLLEHLQQNLGRGEYAVQGVAAVLDAIRRAAVDTVVISDDPTSTLSAWFGPETGQLGLDRDEVAALGVDEPASDRLDSVLIRAVMGTGAQLVVTPNAHKYVTDGIAALLRY